MLHLADILTAKISYFFSEGIGLGVDGIATAGETASLWASFRQEVVVWHKLDHQNVTKVHLAFDSSFG
ncbi:hypothetical protein REPUB_Repub01dG0222800 [Reevesia pubescens]